MTADNQLRDRIADAIRPRMLIGLQDAELNDAPGRERINEWADSIATWATEVVQPELDQLRAGAVERAALLEEARDALEAAGMPGAHGDDWPAVAPAIRALAAERDAARAQAAAARQFADEMADYCSPHGIAADYARRLTAALDRAADPTTT